MLELIWNWTLLFTAVGVGIYLHRHRAQRRDSARAQVVPEHEHVWGVRDKEIVAGDRGSQDVVVFWICPCGQEKVERVRANPELLFSTAQQIETATRTVIEEEKQEKKKSDK